MERVIANMVACQNYLEGNGPYIGEGLTKDDLPAIRQAIAILSDHDAQVPKTAKPSSSCSCNISTLMAVGCKCGSISK